MIKRDNCKDCQSQCEHAGKDREFVCIKGVSCKVTKPRDLVEVVRCKYCYHGEPCTKWNGDEYLGCLWIPGEVHEVEPDHFCSYGERRTDENND